MFFGQIWRRQTGYTNNIYTDCIMDSFGNSSTRNLMANVSLNSSDTTLSISTNSPGRSTVLLVSVACLSFVGTVGNSLFILCFWLEKKLRTVSNYLITFLAVADIMACLGCMLVFIFMANRLSSVDSCWYWLSTAPLIPIISMYCQFLISIDRTVLVTQSVVTYRKWFTKKLCTVYAFGGWIFHVIVIVILLTTGKPSEVIGQHRCMSLISLRFLKQRPLFIVVGCFIIYCGLAFACYGRLVYHVRHRRVVVNSAKKAYVKTSITLLILCVFTVSSTCISPVILYFSFSFINNPRIFAAFGEVGIFVFFLGFSINPFLYGYRIKTFRTKLKFLLTFCWIKRVVPFPATGTDTREISLQHTSLHGRPLASVA